MKLILSLLNSVWIIIKTIISNPPYLLLIVVAILLKIYFPKLRGMAGEFKVKQRLKCLPKKEYIVLNDIMLEDENGTHQIDHIVISQYGIFVIETKNYDGMIVGDEYKSSWIQYLGKNKSFFKNPIHQNYGHVKVLEKILNLGNDVFIPIVCFSNQAKLKVQTNSIVIELDYLIKTIKSFYKVLISKDINIIATTIESLNIIDKDKRKQHIKNIKLKIKEDKQKEDNMICPKCGNKLILKNGKYGTFTACSNYPKCKYTKNNN